MRSRAYEGLVVFNYQLVEKLGDGGFGMVYRAEHVDLGRQAACKILYPEYVRQPELVERFFNEARVVCRIGHRAIIDIQNYGALDTGEPFYLMEYFQGQDLAQDIRRNGALTFDDAVAVFEPIAEALDAAHAKGVIHRDLKPGNIMLRRDGPDGRGRVVEVKLLDFGIAKLVDAANTSSSRTGVAMGTPTYMAPEQARDAKNIDQRADVYGFAATLFTALCGHPPFANDNLTELIIAVQTQSPRPLTHFLPHAPPELSHVLARCMSKAPPERPATVREAWAIVRAALASPVVSGAVAAFEPAAAPPWSRAQGLTPAPIDEPVRASNGGLESIPTTPMAPVQTTLGSAGSELGSLRTGSRSQGWKWIAAASLVLAVAVGGLLAAGEDGGGAGAGDAAALVEPQEESAPGADRPSGPDEGEPAAGAEVDGGQASGSHPFAGADPSADDEVKAASPDGGAAPVECSTASFDAMDGGRADDAEREAVLARLDECLARAQIDAAFHAGVKARLARRSGATGQPGDTQEEAAKPDGRVARKPDAKASRKRDAQGGDRSRARQDCSTASFRKVYRDPKPSADAVQEALVRLKSCHKSRKLDDGNYNAILRKLLAKL